MKPAVLRGMTSDHRRAIDSLINTAAMFRGQNPSIAVDWSTRPHSGFAFTPVTDLARSFDLIIFDHPLMGAAANSRCLLQLNGVCGDDAMFAGASLDTYRLHGNIWALPVDAACQVAVSRPDLLQALGEEAAAL